MLGSKREKIALVDVDGTLLIGGKINPHLLAHLQAGGYDQIWLFTQRAAHLTEQTCLLNLDPEDPREDIALQSTLSGVKTALEAADLNIAGVSTSYDLPLGHLPGQYYETTLKGLDNEIAVRSASRMNGTPLIPESEGLANAVRGEKDEAVSDAVQNKNKQMSSLLEHIIGTKPTTSDAEVIFIDDHPDNFAELRTAMMAAEESDSVAGAASAAGAAETIIPDGMSLHMVLAEETKTADEYATEITRQMQLPDWLLGQAQTGQPVESALLNQIMRMSDKRATLVADALASTDPTALDEACKLPGGLIAKALCTPTTAVRAAFCFFGGHTATDYLAPVSAALAEKEAAASGSECA